MTTSWRIMVLAALAAVLAPLVLARPAYADHCSDDKRIMGGNYHLAEGETLDSNLVVFGGNAAIDAGATVNCTVVVVGGDADIAGAVAEDVVVFGGATVLRSTAVIDGELVTIGGDTTREAGAVVRGGESQGFDFDGPWPRIRTNVPFFDPVLNWYQGVFRTLGSAVLMGLLALLVALFLPEHTSRVAAAITAAPVASGGLGLLTLVAVPVLLALAAITLCLIPVTVVGAIVFGAALLFGWIALGQIVGVRLASALRLYNLSPAVAAGLGTGLLWLLASAVDAVLWIPCVDVVAWGLLSSLGLGAVVLTRFGIRPYLPALAAPPPPPAEITPTAG
jgi:hypothetical protein